MRWLTLISLRLVFMAASVSAFGSDIPQGSKFDSRIQFVNYNAGDVVVVNTVVGVGLRLVFSPNETILDVASGFSQGWEFSDRRNMLYIKAKSIKNENGPSLEPQPGKWDTNLMVTTNCRMYDLDLHLMPSPNSGKVSKNPMVSYRVEFKYPEDEAAVAKAMANKSRTQAKMDLKPEPINWNYSMQIGEHSENIAPTMAYDDGRFTYLKFPNNRDFPAAFLVALDKTESLVNSHIDPAMPDVLVLQRVSREMVLRLGSAVVGIYNDKYDADGIPPDQGTTVPGVKRIIRGTGQ